MYACLYVCQNPWHMSQQQCKHIKLPTKVSRPWPRGVRGLHRLFTFLSPIPSCGLLNPVSDIWLNLYRLMKKKRTQSQTRIRNDQTRGRLMLLFSGSGQRVPGLMLAPVGTPWLLMLMVLGSCWKHPASQCAHLGSRCSWCRALAGNLWKHTSC